MKRILYLSDYKESRSYIKNSDIFDEIEGNLKIFEKDLEKYITSRKLMSRLIKYDEENRA